MSKILVVGATGTVGREVVRTLIDRGMATTVLARDRRRARDMLGPRVSIVEGDLADRRSLTNALSGIDVAYLATTPGPELADQEINLVEAARAAKLRRLVKLSAFGVRTAPDRIHQCHALGEQRVRDSGLDYALLQPVMFMSNLSWEAASIKANVIASIDVAATFSRVLGRRIEHVRLDREKLGRPARGLEAWVHAHHADFTA